jgi:hypothetical protein
MADKKYFKTGINIYGGRIGANNGSYGGIGGTITITAGNGGASTTLGGTGAVGRTYGYQEIEVVVESKFKNGDIVKTPDGAGKVFSVEMDEDGVLVCVCLAGGDQDVLHEYGENELSLS